MSAVSKKSFSSVSSPILACIRVTSTLVCCSALSSPKTPPAPSCSRVFHSVIWFGWTSNCWASSARVLSPFRAAKATFALKAAVWFRRGRRVIVAPRFCHLNGRQGTTFPLIPLSESPDPAYYAILSTLGTACRAAAGQEPRHKGHLVAGLHWLWCK